MITKHRPNRDKLNQAKELRRNMTVAESIIWEAVRRDNIDGLHFRRQQVIAGFIVDFYCHAARLIIEIDGPVHMQQPDHDKERGQILESYDLRVLRFTNDEVLDHLPDALQRIRAVCHERLKPDPPASNNPTPFY